MLLRHLAGSLLAVVLVQPSQPAPVRLAVRVEGVSGSLGGAIRVGLHRTPGAGFPGASSFENQVVAAASPDAVVSFTVPAGTYAVSVHHDANANSRMDTNILGIPKEGYGVSNNARPRFSAPKFGAASVVVSTDTTLIVRVGY